MRPIDTDAAILHFFRDEIGGILINDEAGNILYNDGSTAFIIKEKTNWKAACPKPVKGQKAEMWDLLRNETGKTYMVVTSTSGHEDGLVQIHHLVDTSLYMDLYKDLAAYSKLLRMEKDHDGLTGLYNRAKFNEMSNALFSRQETIAVFNMDVNNLKQMNDNNGHEAGDRLLKKAAESLKKVEARNIIPFRVGGDEFLLVALHVNEAEALKIRESWEDGLAELNRKDDGTYCEIACGFVYADKGFHWDEVLALADQRMYEDKVAKKQKARMKMLEEKGRKL